MKPIKYVLHGAHIHSKNDSDRHYISAAKLVELYKLDREECILIDLEDNQNKFRGLEDKIHLYPDYNGDYTIK